MIVFVYLYLAWSAIAEFFLTWTPGLLSYVDEAIAIVLLIHLLWVHGDRKNATRHLLPITRSIRWLLAICALSFVVNMGSPVNALQFTFSITKSFVLFYWVLSFVRDDRVEKYTLGLVTFLIIVQIPFFMYGFATVGRSYVGDYARGAMVTGSAHEVGLYMAMGVVMSLAFFLTTERKKYLAYGFVCFVFLAVTSTKQVIYMLPLALVVLLWKQFKLNVFRLTIITLMFSAGYFVYRQSESAWGQAQTGDQDTPISDDGLTLADALLASEKAQGYNDALFEAPKEFPVPLLGAGPGEYASFTAMGHQTRLAQKYITSYLDLIPEGEFGTMVTRTSGVISLWGDIGPFGLVIMLFIYFWLFLTLYRQSTHTYETDRKASIFLALASCLLILSSSFLINIFEGNSFVLCVFWILSGSLLRRSEGMPIVKKEET